MPESPAVDHRPGAILKVRWTMSRESRLTAGVLLVVLPTVMYGGLTLLSLLTARAPGIADNPLRHDLWRA